MDLISWSKSELFHANRFRFPLCEVIEVMFGGLFLPVTTLYLHITSNYRQIWRPDYPMGLFVSSIDEDINEQNSNVNKCLCR